MAVGHLTARRAKVKRGGYYVLEGVSDACAILSVSFEMLGAPPSFPRETLTELYSFVYSLFSGTRPMRSDDFWDLCSPMFNPGKEKSD